MDYRINDGKNQILVEQVSKRITDDIVDQLVAYRKSIHMTQQDVADITGIKRANIARIEGKRSEASLDSLVRYAKSLNLRVKLSLEEEEANTE